MTWKYRLVGKPGNIDEFMDKVRKGGEKEVDVVLVSLKEYSEHPFYGIKTILGCIAGNISYKETLFEVSAEELSRHTLREGVLPSLDLVNQLNKKRANEVKETLETNGLSVTFYDLLEKEYHYLSKKEQDLVIKMV